MWNFLPRSIVTIINQTQTSSLFVLCFYLLFYTMASTVQLHGGNLPVWTCSSRNGSGKEMRQIFRRGSSQDQVLLQQRKLLKQKKHLFKIYNLESSKARLKNILINRKSVVKFLTTDEQRTIDH